MKLKVYVHNNISKEGNAYVTYTAKSKKTKEWVNVIFSKKVTERPEIDSVLELDQKDIFKSQNETDKQVTYVIMNIKSMSPIESTLIEEDFFY